MPRLEPVIVPAAFDGYRRRGPQWARWLDGLPRLASTLLTDWALELHGPPEHGWGSLVLPVRDAQGRALVLKLAFPEPDTAGEIPALKAWRGEGAVRLERADPRRGAMLLERLGPADLNSVDEDDATRVLAGLYRQIHIPAPPTVPALAPFVVEWLDGLEAIGHHAPAPPRLVRQAIGVGRELASEMQQPRADLRVVHGDLHGRNVLAAQRAPWLVIDPSGFAGDPCYEPGPWMWNRWPEIRAAGDAGEAIRRRFWALVDAAELDERRARDWTLVRAMIALYWRVERFRRDGSPLDADATDWVTRCVTVAKAMQSVVAS